MMRSWPLGGATLIFSAPVTSSLPPPASQPSLRAPENIFTIDVVASAHADREHRPSRDGHEIERQKRVNDLRMSHQHRDKSECPYAAGESRFIAGTIVR